MGHTRLGRIPTSQKWKQVVTTLASNDYSTVSTTADDDVANIAANALEAAEAGLDSAIEDPALRYTFYLLTQIVLAAREGDWESRLIPFGIQLSGDATLFDLTSTLQSAIDDYRFQRSAASDIGEMAQRAAGEALFDLASPRARTLFGEGREELTQAIKRLATRSGFAQLGQNFFGTLLADFLNFHLSRATASQLGSPRLRQVGDLSRFNDALRRHCQQSAKIVHDFCGEWFSKTEFREGISLANTSNFMAVAVKKLRDELREQAKAS
jgi:hypothetical protein